MKTCGRCRVEKEETEFGRSSKTADGLRSQCKACRRAEGEARADAKREYDKARYVENRSARLAAAAVYRKQIPVEQAREYNRSYYERNRDQLRERAAQWAVTNRARMLAKKAEYREQNREEVRAAVRDWSKRNRAAKRSLDEARRRSHARAAPKWRNTFFIAEAYRLARLRTRITGVPWHVDHVVPLISKTVCGLHVEQNLSVVPAAVNVKKGNRTWPDMPH